MGGGGGFSPIPIITTLIFGPEAGGLVGAAMASLTPTRSAPDSASDSGAAQAAQLAAEQEAERASEERRRADRKRAEAALLDQARSAHRAGLAGQNSLAQTLGAPVVETSQLKEKLGQ